MDFGRVTYRRLIRSWRLYRSLSESLRSHLCRLSVGVLRILHCTRRIVSRVVGLCDIVVVSGIVWLRVSVVLASYMSRWESSSVGLHRRRGEMQAVRSSQ